MIDINGNTDENFNVSELSIKKCLKELSQYKDEELK